MAGHLHLSPDERGRAGERAAWLLVVATLFVGGYFGVGRAVDPTTARSIATPLDAALPFWPASIFVYVTVFPGALLPLFTVRCPRLFRRTALAYVAVIAVSLACFVALPVTSLPLRADTASLASGPGPSRVLEDWIAWGVRTLYAWDPPVNLFPSLHLAVATVAASVSGRARRAYGLLAGVWVAAVAVSVCTIKQHYVLDAVAGVALGAAAHGALAARVRLARPAAYGWRGPLAFAALLGLVFAGFGLLYTLGLGAAA